MHIETITTLNAVENIKKQWLELFYDNCGFSIFEHYDWIYQRYKELGNNNIILFLVINEKRKIAGIFPFAIQPYKFKKISFNALVHAAGASADYSSFLMAKSHRRKITPDPIGTLGYLQYI